MLLFKKKEKIKVIENNALNDLVIVYYFMILRILSFTLEKIDNLSNPSITFKYDLVNFLNYLMYPSFATVASFVPFKNFALCVSYLKNFCNRFFIFMLIFNIKAKYSKTEFS